MFAKKSEGLVERERHVLLHAYKDHVLLWNRLMVDLGVVKEALDPEDLKAKLNSKQMAAFTRVMAFHTQHTAMEAWPEGSADRGDEAIAALFRDHLPETFRLNGRQKYFLYLLAKRGGQMPREQLTELGNFFAAKFPGMGGAPAPLAELELETLAFIEKETPSSPNIKIAEPFYSRLRALELP